MISTKVKVHNLIYHKRKDYGYGVYSSYPEVLVEVEKKVCFFGFPLKTTHMTLYREPHCNLIYDVNTGKSHTSQFSDLLKAIDLQEEIKLLTRKVLNDSGPR